MTASRLICTALVAAFASAHAALAPDSFGYTADGKAAFSYADISGTGTSVLANTDDGTATLNIPFGFRFYGTTYTSVCVSSNGLMSFGNCVPSDFTNLDLTSQAPTGGSPLIAPFWMDLSFSTPGAGSVLYQTLGQTGSRRFIVEWNNAAALNTPGALNFQAILNEASNTVLFQYLTVETANTQVSKGAGATVGIRGAGSPANGFDLQWSFRAPVISNNTAIQFTPPRAAAPTDVSSMVTVTTSGFVYNRVTQIYSGTVFVENTSSAAIAGPITVVLTSLTAGVTAVGAAGVLPGQGPYYTNTVPGNNSLAPGKTVPVNVQFTDPSAARIGFVTQTYSGSF